MKQTILKKPIFIILILVAVSTFILSVVLKIIATNRTIKPGTLPEPKVQSNHINPIQLKFSYAGQLPQLETETLVYTSTNKDAFTEASIDTITKKFGFTKAAEIDQGIEKTTAIIAEESKDIVISNPPFTIEYGNYTQPSSKNVLTKPEQYVEVAQKYIDGLNIDLTYFSLDKGYIQPMQTDTQGITIPVNNFNQAEYVSVEFNYLLKNIPILEKERKQTSIQILCNLDGTIRKATVIFPPTNIESVGKTTITLPTQALHAINNGMGVFSRLNDPLVAYTEIQQKDMSTAIFNSVELVYIYDYDTGSIQPFYRFQGYGYTKNGDKIEVGVIITALPQDLYIK